MKEIFRNKKWIAFFLAFILVVTVGVNSSDAFLWAVGDVEETASEESGTQAHSSDEEAAKVRLRRKRAEKIRNLLGKPV